MHKNLRALRVRVLIIKGNPAILVTKCRAADPDGFALFWEAGSEKMDADPHKSQNSGDIEAQN